MSEDKDYYVQTIIVRKSNKDYPIYHFLCMNGNNTYNFITYHARQMFIKYGQYPGYLDLYHIIKHANQFHENTLYQDLSNGIIIDYCKLVERNFKSFFKANKEYHKDPNKFTGRPRIPKYHKKHQMCEITLSHNNFRFDYDKQEIYWIKRITKKTPKWKINLSPIKLDRHFHVDDVVEIHIIPFHDRFVLKIVYEVNLPEFKFDNHHYLGIDPGMNNLMTCASNIRLRPFIISGGPAKSINQFARKKLAFLQSRLSKCHQGFSSHRIDNLYYKRNQKMESYFHEVSKSIVEYALSHGINHIIIGQGIGSKRNSKLSKKNKQNFVQIPHGRLIWMITYKARMKGIDVTQVEESYTSQTSALDNEQPESCNGNYARKRKGIKNSVRRKTRGTFVRDNGQVINADVNAALQIIRKEIPDIIYDGIEDVVIRPTHLKSLICD